jgi:hypothetical protein
MNVATDDLMVSQMTDPQQPKPTPNAMDHLPTFTMTVEPSDGKPMEANLPLPGPINVQAVLEQSGVQKRFRRMEIELWRPLPQGHHKLEVPYERAKQSVPASYDYSIRPGDRLIVREDNSSMLDDALGALQLPFFR